MNDKYISICFHAEIKIPIADHINNETEIAELCVDMLRDQLENCHDIDICWDLEDFIIDEGYLIESKKLHV